MREGVQVCQGCMGVQRKGVGLWPPNPRGVSLVACNVCNLHDIPGFVAGSETPESWKCTRMFDASDRLMACLFPDQDRRCWDRKWIT